MKTSIGILLTLTVVHGLACAQPSVSTVLNAASYEAVISPGSWVAIFGSNLAAAPASAATVPLPTTLGGVSLTVAGRPAALLYVSPNQVNALIPSETLIPASSVVPLVVTAASGNAQYNIRLTRNAPAIFTRNGAGTGRALIFDSNFQPIDTVAKNDVVILYATGLGAASGTSNALVDEVEVYIGERKAEVLFAGLAAGYPGIYQLNVRSAAPATDRLYLRSGGWQSNIVDVGIKPGANTSNVKGTIDSLYPSADGSGGNTFLPVMLHAGTMTVSFDINPSAAPFDVAAVGEAGGVVISIDPASGSYTASIATLTAAGAKGDFSGAIVPLWDYATCNPRTLECHPFPLSTPTTVRLGELWMTATQKLPPPSTITSPGVNAIALTPGCLGAFRWDESCIGAPRFVVDSQNNQSLAVFGGILQQPLGPFRTRVSSFKLYVDGVRIASKDVTYWAPVRTEQ